MKINTVGRKVALKPQFLQLVDEKLAKLNKFFSEEAVATVTVTVEKKWHTVEVSVKDRKATFRSEKSADQMENALEFAVDNLELQIVRNKGKIAQKFKGYNFSFPQTQSEEDDDYEVVRTKLFSLTPQSVDDAILEMNMLGHEFFMFKDIVTEEINVVYRRKDGNYGLLLPE